MLEPRGTVARLLRKRDPELCTGDVADHLLYVDDWGFRLEDVDLEVGLWYGSQDRQAPSAMGSYLASRLPRSTLTVVDGGHFSTINDHAEDIFGFLTA